jgi:nucleoid-associated protein YgaU
MLLLEEPPAEPPTTRVAPQTVALTDDDWVVESGDSFWSIAEEMLSDYQGPGQDEVDVALYCRQLIAANRDRLATPDEPNLLFPGQVLTVPPPAS